MPTANLNMTLAVTGADSDSWGDILNADMGTIDAFAGKLMGAAEVTVASASTCNIGAAACTAVAISGTTTITSFGTAANTIRFIRFTGILTLTHNATSLILLGGANHTTAAGDTGIYKSDASGNWREMAYHPVSYNPGANTGAGAYVHAVSPTFTGTTTVANLLADAGAVHTSLGGWSNATWEVLSGQAAAPAISGYNNASTGEAFRARVDNTNSPLLNCFFSTGQVGSISTNGSSTAYNTSSDRRLKQNIADADLAQAWAVVKALRVRSWDWISTGQHEAFGLVAQEEVLAAPFAVRVGDGDPEVITDQWGRDDAKLVPALTRVIQDLEVRLAALEAA